MESISLGINCYRAILAQVNSLESVWPKPNTLKQIYEELTELSFSCSNKTAMVSTRASTRCSLLWRI